MSRSPNDAIPASSPVYSNKEEKPYLYMVKGNDFRKIGETKYVQIFFPDGTVIFDWFSAHTPIKILTQFVKNETNEKRSFKLYARLNTKPPKSTLLANGNDPIKSYVAANTVTIDLKYE